MLVLLVLLLVLVVVVVLLVLCVMIHHIHLLHPTTSLADHAGRLLPIRGYPLITCMSVSHMTTMLGFHVLRRDPGTLSLSGSTRFHACFCLCNCVRYATNSSN